LKKGNPGCWTQTGFQKRGFVGTLHFIRHETGQREKTATGVGQTTLVGAVERSS
jgi:hypothetical protein